MTDSPLLELLDDLRRRLLFLSGLSALAWGMLAAMGVLIFGAWGDLVFDFPGWLRITILLTAGGAAIGWMISGIHQALLRGRTSALAQQLDITAHSDGQILTGVDLARMSAVGKMSSVSQGLAQIAVAQAAQLAENVPSQLAIPAKPLKQASIILAAGCACSLLLTWFAPRMVSTELGRFFDPYGDHPPYTNIVFSVEPGDTQVIYGRGAEILVNVIGDDVERVDLILQPESAKTPESLPMFPDPDGRWKASVANITQPTKYYVRSGHARSRNYDFRVITVPKLEAVRFEIVPPAYTQRPPYHGLLPSQGIAGLIGTTVRFWGRSNRPLSGGVATVTTKSNDSVELVPVESEPLEVTGSFVITEPGKLQFAVTDRDGQTSEETFTAPIRVLKDERPMVRLLQPREVSFATPSVILPVIIAAEDDFGLSKVQVFRSLNDSRYSPADLELAAPPPTRWQSEIPLPLSEYGLSPGDVLKVFARVEDNSPEEPQGAESEIATIRIIAEEEFDRLVRRQEGVDQLQAKYQQARRRVEQVAEELETLQKQIEEKAAQGEAVTDEDREKLQTLAKRMEEEAKAVEELQKDNELPYDLDKELSKELGAMSETLNEMAQELRKRSEDEPKQSMEQLAQSLEEMREQLQQELHEFDQNVTEPLDMLENVFELMKDQARFTEMYRQQESLAERLRSLKNRTGEDNPSLQRRMRDLEAEQERVRNELSDLLEDIESHAAQLPEKPELEQLRDQAQEFCESCRASGAMESMRNAELGLSEFSGSKGHAGAQDAKEQLEQLLKKSEEMQANGGPGLQNGLQFKPSLGNAAADTLQQLLAEAGMSPGQGSSGSGGGYSSRRNSLDNVGLYGGKPEFESQKSSMMSQQSQQQQGKFTHRFGGDEQTPGEGAAGDLQGSQAAGRAEAQAPTAYRRRVSAYFERVVDELND